MIQLTFHNEAADVPQGSASVVPVLMYGRRPPHSGSASIGGPVRREVRRIGARAHRAAFDFLTVAMAVTAADTFVDRGSSDDGWARNFLLKIQLSDPAAWGAVHRDLTEALRFLSGDMWAIELTSEGPEPPVPQTRGRLTKLVGHDSVSLFSGGLDSAIGVIDLLASGRRPLLISHSYRGDAQRQSEIRRKLPLSATPVSQFSAMANPVSWLDGTNDVQMRTRSLNFLAYGALVGATIVEQGFVSEPIDLFVPENGLIALNPPLTSRRIGALSTRTTHPHFLKLVQRVLDGLGIPVRISNPYSLKTKGEMMLACADQNALSDVAAHTVSCGKWKRTGIQCGKCVPCLIRRASFHGSGMSDRTQYASSGTCLSSVMSNGSNKDDLLAMILAARALSDVDTSRWVRKAGPLPANRGDRDALVDVANRGMLEVRDYLDHLGLLN